LLAHIFKREGKLVPHLIPDHPADADPARLGEGFPATADDLRADLDQPLAT
jgi:hypothetical protein